MQDVVVQPGLFGFLRYYRKIRRPLGRSGARGGGGSSKLLRQTAYGPDELGGARRGHGSSMLLSFW